MAEVMFEFLYKPGPREYTRTYRNMGWRLEPDGRFLVVQYPNVTYADAKEKLERWNNPLLNRGRYSIRVALSDSEER